MSKIRLIFALTFLTAAVAAGAQTPVATVVEGPNVKVLTGLLAPDFQEEMNRIVEGLGGSCGTCHARGNFASEENPRKLKARDMLTMVKALNKQYFPDYKPKDGESVLGRITCFTCHQGDLKPKTGPGQ
jgi:cytochrome c553